METSDNAILEKDALVQGELLAGSYHVCESCKEGMFQGGVRSGDPLTSFIVHHSNLCGSLKMVSGTDFLTQYLRDGYIDVNRPDMKPVGLRLGPPEEHEVSSKFGAAAALEIQKRMRRGGVAPRPGPVVRAPEESDLLRSSRALLVSIRQELNGAEALKRDLELMEYALLQYISHYEEAKKAIPE